MMGRKNRDAAVPEDTAAPQSFDDFDLKLGDMMRGERATLGKSLLDVQRELRIKAGYIAAIENCDPSAFDTPGFIAGYVRSYARYLGMDPEEAFSHFCAESGFSVAHGMSNKASTIRKPAQQAPVAPVRARDPLINPKTPFVARDDSFFTGIQPAAIGSSLVLLALVGGIGYGAWSVLQEVQRVQLSPVDQTPLVLSELDPLESAMSPAAMPEEAEGDDMAGVFAPPSRDWYDRMQRPEALDTPILVARDGPISTLDPDRGGVYAGFGAGRLPQIDESIALDQTTQPADTRAADVAVVAVRPAWVRIDDASGTTLFSGILNGGERFEVPADAVSPRIEVGESGAVYFAVAGQAYGPAGPTGAVTADIKLSAADLSERYAPADPSADRDLEPLIASLQAQAVDSAVASALDGALPATPKVLADAPAGVTVVATADAWVRVRTANGTTLFETVMKAGETYQVPTTETPPTIRAGNAGAIYFAVNGQTYGPYGGAGAVADNLALAADAISTQMAQANPASDSRLARIVAELASTDR
ncbi:RodZ domain-containing protein [Citreimonas sp.]|uniref:RodZ domain-containing protein n=1 Tax=Citreimonas sp. TaxID=3036715 RepID=UPI0035C7A349